MPGLTHPCPSQEGIAAVKSQRSCLISNSGSNGFSLPMVGWSKPSPARNRELSLRNEDFITSHVCRAGILPALGQPGRLSHVIESPPLRKAKLHCWTWTGVEFVQNWAIEQSSQGVCVPERIPWVWGIRGRVTVCYRSLHGGRGDGEVSLMGFYNSFGDWQVPGRCRWIWW